MTDIASAFVQVNQVDRDRVVALSDNFQKYNLRKSAHLGLEKEPSGMKAE